MCPGSFTAAPDPLSTTKSQNVFWRGWWAPIFLTFISELALGNKESECHFIVLDFLWISNKWSSLTFLTSGDDFHSVRGLLPSISVEARGCMWTRQSYSIFTIMHTERLHLLSVVPWPTADVCVRRTTFYSAQDYWLSEKILISPTTPTCDHLIGVVFFWFFRIMGDELLGDSIDTSAQSPCDNGSWKGREDQNKHQKCNQIRISRPRDPSLSGRRCAYVQNSCRPPFLGSDCGGIVQGPMLQGLITTNKRIYEISGYLLSKKTTLFCPSRRPLLNERLPQTQNVTKQHKETIH